MGGLFCILSDTTQIAAVARDVCPFPDYGPSLLLKNMMSANSYLHLSQHYAAVQASLTPRQQQDFIGTMRSTFGQEGKVYFGGMKIVALSLAIFFDTVASRVKGEYVSDQEPIPGLFLRNPTGIYPAPVYTVSKYLRLVPHIANNPTRMKDETEKYLLEIIYQGKHFMDNIFMTKKVEDIQVSYGGTLITIVINMARFHHLSGSEIKIEDLTQTDKKNEEELNIVHHLNCVPNVASERFMLLVDSMDEDSKTMVRDCSNNNQNMTILENIANGNLAHNSIMKILHEEESMLDKTRVFDLKANALGRWM